MLILGHSGRRGIRRGVHWSVKVAGALGGSEPVFVVGWVLAQRGPTRRMMWLKLS